MDELELAGAPVYDETGNEIGRVTDVSDAEGGARSEGLWIRLDGEERPVHVSRDMVREGRPERVTLGVSRQSLIDDDRTVTVPLHEEVLDATTREVERGRVRVRTRVETVPHEATVNVTREDVSVERVPVGQIVDRAPEPRWEGDTLIVPLVEEVLFIEKRLQVREELRITRNRAGEQRTIREDLRREAADVETSGDIDVTGPV